MHYIGAGYGQNEVIAYEEEIEEDENPYFDFHLGKYRGRWLRVGVVERLFKLQERANTVVNQNAESTAIASLLLLRSNDPNTTGNVLQGAVNGQIVTSSDLQQIGITNTAYNLLLGELDRIERQADKLCFTPEIISGDLDPSGVPFRGMATLNNAAKSAFTYIKQSIGETIGYLITEEILPEVVKGWNRETLIDMIDDTDDIRIFDEAVIKAKTAEVLRANLYQNKVTTKEDLDNVAAEVMNNIERSGRKLELPKGFFNFDFGISLNVSGESTDKSVFKKNVF